MVTPEAFLTNCRLADGRLVDIGIADGKIACVGEGVARTMSLGMVAFPWLNLAASFLRRLIASADPF